MERWNPDSALAGQSPSIEMSVLRSGAIIIAVTGFLWQIESAIRSVPLENFLSHWFPFASLLIFILSDMLLIWAVINNTRRGLIAALRVPMYIMLVFLMLVSTYWDLPHNSIGNALWYSPFSGLALAAFALTVPLHISLSVMVFVPGLIAVINSWLLGHTFWLDMLSDVGFNLINTFPFVIIAGSAQPVARLIDYTYENSRKVNERAERMRVRGEAMSSFNAYVHDYVLAALSAIGKGSKIDFSLDEQTGLFFSPRQTVSGRTFAEAVRAQLLSVSSDISVTLDTSEEGGPVRLPGEVANTFLLAATEVANNAKRHAGTTAEKKCHIRVASGEVSIDFRDDGSGFDPEGIDPHRAGIRLSVKGRMEALRGGDADVKSKPGKGTQVILKWHGNTSPVEEEDVVDSSAHTTSLYDLMGMSIVFSWQFYGAIVGVLFMVLVSNGQLFTTAGQISLALAIGLLGLIMYGRHSQLPLNRAFVIGVAIVVLAGVGLYQPIPNNLEWSYFWHFSLISFASALLAIRGRPWVALNSVLGGAILVEILKFFPFAPSDSTHISISGVDLLVRSVMLVAGILTSIMVRFFMRTVPQSIQDYNRALYTAGAAKEYEISSQSNYEWLQRQVGPIFSAAAVLDKPTPRLQLRARLTEQLLRDVLRSPHLNVGSLHQAVWDARARGVHVRLLDDRNHTQAVSGSTDVRRIPLVDDDSAVAKLMPSFLETIDNAEEGSVTIRLLPPGRRAFASISDDNGVQRFDEAGERIVMSRD
ncbi:MULTISPECIES: sensor histidine kinase [Corynebacterium]|uniref:ATP-binding protein n=1 Tax=Corynebacterium amycolatum TaxID=43765 RepID=A0AB38XTL1_CORAY|nr:MULTISPECIES: ATP-binding protein [Corynebacterium]AIN82437.1 histidine kinase-, DNA gyrase B-, and HSP90-like ATPase family protein [Corynebacterium sp. ATCC 6931]KAA9270335.1 ATP-binding protein [Corynebacterium amycolatum]MBC6726992.1 ATP-binding protein [Corynebacterium amycolatum]MBU5623894.1 ATP-binding protein [Corynebacterium amycolatum]MDY7342336.1 ATP-binding protein [Corynebacterium amycolatum]